METKTVVGLLWLILALSGTNGHQCGHPAVPANARVTISGYDLTNADKDQLFAAGSTAEFSCDRSYQLVGNGMLICSGNGRWQGELPLCGVNVALGKIANQSSTIRGGSAFNAIDADVSKDSPPKCTETGQDSSPWWMVDLMTTYAVHFVKITTRPCCGFPLHDLEIRVGNNTNPQKNPLCSWSPGSIDEGETRLFRCAKPLYGQLVFVQMVGVEASLSLCQVEVFSSGDIPRESCTDSPDTEGIVAFNRTCYEAHLNEGTSFAKARSFCKHKNGDLWNNVPDSAMELLVGQFERNKSTMKSQMVWLGAEKEPSFTSRTWRWITGDVIDRPQWGREQPNNYNGEQNCVVLDGARDWLWNDVGCNLDYFHWVCMFGPMSCGSPDRNENSTIIGRNFSSGATIRYQCPSGSVTVGTDIRTCMANGLWSDSPPTCKHIDCGPLDNPENGSVVLQDSRTTFNATVVYTCMDQYTLVGSSMLKCTANGTWEPGQPKCLYGRCEALPPVERGNVNVTGTTVGGMATYSCDAGHQLVGDKVIECELGGKWSAPVPQCVFVDCGLLPSPPHGIVTLLNGTTTLHSLAVYSCDEDYVLEGEETRFCQGDGRWSASQPACMPIDCGEPEVPNGGYVTGFETTVHSQVEYHCDPGYLLMGNSRRICTSAGTWSGEAPICLYVDCGTLPGINNGKILYWNQTTSLGSEAIYSCNANFRLEGSARRTCRSDGKWSGTPAQCREIRCPLPERPTGSILSISSSDRLRAVSFIKASDREATSSTFRIGSNVNYKCERGYRLDGKNTRICEAGGIWTGEAPTCTFVDCGSPEEVAHGSLKLPNNGTYLGSYVHYSCDTDYYLDGYERRVCLENGSWSGTVPECKEIACPELSIEADSGLLLSVISNNVGGLVEYNCKEGYQLVGQSSRSCLHNGQWNGFQPLCELLDCDEPEGIENGRVFLVNGTTTFGSVAEYHCIPGFARQGVFIRLCTAEAQWSDAVPICVQEELVLLKSNKIEELSSVKNDSGISFVWIGIGVALCLLVLLLIGLVYFKMKRGALWTWDKTVYPTAKPSSKKSSSSSLSPPNVPLPPTPGTHIGATAQNPRTVYSYSNADIYEHLPENLPDNQHMYDLTYEESVAFRRNLAERPKASPPPPPTGVTVNGLTMTRFNQQ